MSSPARTVNKLAGLQEGDLQAAQSDEGSSTNTSQSGDGGEEKQLPWGPGGDGADPNDDEWLLKRFDTAAVAADGDCSDFDEIVKNTEEERQGMDDMDELLNELSEKTTPDGTPRSSRRAHPATAKYSSLSVTSASSRKGLSVLGGAEGSALGSVAARAAGGGRRRSGGGDLIAAQGLKEYGEEDWKTQALSTDDNHHRIRAGVGGGATVAFKVEMPTLPSVTAASSARVAQWETTSSRTGLVVPGATGDRAEELSSIRVADGAGFAEEDEQANLLATALIDDPNAQNSKDVPLLQYIWEMVANCTSTNTVRGKQSRLTLWEALEHFDFMNDFLFICRVGATTFTASTDTLESQNSVNMGKIAMVCLLAIWITSAVAYALRHVIIYHRIENEHMWLFCPFVVFQKIRTVGDTSPEVLYMFERVFWTYQIIMRLVEDIPQVICSAVFLSTFGSDFYTYFMISYSCMLIILTSYRMGVMYPIFGTLSLILSREPPVDSPVLTEAATTTKNFSGFMFINFTLWLIADMICLYLARGLWMYWFCVLTAIAGFGSCFFLVYWAYLLRQSSEVGGGLEEFHRNFERLGTPRRSSSIVSHGEYANRSLLS